MAILSDSEWDRFTSQHPESHLLQSAAWGELKRQFGWDIERVVQGELGAQILFRNIYPGVTFAYIPKGPLGSSLADQKEWQEFVKEVDHICRKKHAFLLKVEPDIWESENGLNSSLTIPPGFQLSTVNIQPQRTIVVNLDGGEENILNRMKQKTRYNIRLAERSGVTVTPSDNLPLFSEMIQETGERDQFGVHSQSYYQRCYELFHPQGQCELLQANFQDEPLAMLMVFSRGKRAWYLYGASRNVYREKMPTYQLQWEAMRWAKAQGCTAYDLWGVPDEELETLEANFSSRSTGLWGVYRFKRGFGGTLLRSSRPLDRIYNPILYKAYSYWIKRTRRGETD